MYKLVSTLHKCKKKNPVPVVIPKAGQNIEESFSLKKQVIYLIQEMEINLYCYA